MTWPEAFVSTTLHVLDDLIKRGLRRPEFLSRWRAMLGKAIAAVWDGVLVQRLALRPMSLIGTRYSCQNGFVDS